jgi:hypothetical protein
MTSTNTVSILKHANWQDARWTRALRNWIGSAAAVIVRFKALAPYALIELVLPGGSVVALLLWLYRRQNERRCWSLHFALRPRLRIGTPIQGWATPRCGDNGSSGTAVPCQVYHSPPPQGVEHRRQRRTISTDCVPHT